MGQSFAWGIVASSSLLLGGVVAGWLPIGRRALGLIIAFGAGVLISAVSFELVQEAFETSPWEGGTALGLFLGSLVFFSGDWLIDRSGGADRKRVDGGQSQAFALPIVLGIVLDGIPESFVLGLTVLDTGTVSAAFLAAVFLSTSPRRSRRRAGSCTRAGGRAGFSASGCS